MIGEYLKIFFESLSMVMTAIGIISSPGVCDRYVVSWGKRGTRATNV